MHTLCVSSKKIVKSTILTPFYRWRSGPGRCWPERDHLAGQPRCHTWSRSFLSLIPFRARTSQFHLCARDHLWPWDNLIQIPSHTCSNEAGTYKSLLIQNAQHASPGSGCSKEDMICCVKANTLNWEYDATFNKYTDHLQAICIWVQIVNCYLCENKQTTKISNYDGKQHLLLTFIIYFHMVYFYFEVPIYLKQFHERWEIFSEIIL